MMMASQRRVERVQKQIEREVSDMLVRDKVLRRAFSPEESLGADAHLSALASVTGVHLSNDLQVAKVFVSVFTDDVGKQVAQRRLKRTEGHIRTQVGKRIRLRLTPEIRLIFDDSLERGSNVTAILDRLQSERQGFSTARDSSDDDSPIIDVDDEVRTEVDAERAQ
jgi:ribosome-binding factor A